MDNVIPAYAGLMLFFMAFLLLRAGFDRLERLFGKKPPTEVSVTPLRGEGLVPPADAAARADMARAKDPRHPADFPGIPFGSAHLPLSALYTHFLIQGTTGSGKTVTLERILASVLRGPMASGPGRVRAVVFDPKGEWPSKAFAWAPPHADLVLLHPFDRRGSRWELHEDFRTRAELLQLAEMLVPDDKKDANPYFRDAARAVTSAVLTALSAHRGVWGLGDILYFARTRDRLRAVLGVLPETRDVAGQFLNARSAKDVVATLGSCLGKFSPVAACWDRADTGVSLAGFMGRSGVLVLGHDPTVTAALRGVNRLVVKRLTELALSRQGQDDLTLFAFDEFRQFGRSEGLLDVAIQGRSSGASLVVAFQDVNGLDATHDGKTARELLSLLQNRLFLTAGSTEAAAYAAGAFGKQEVKEVSPGTSAQTNAGAGVPASTTASQSTRVTLREVVLPAEVLGLPPADPAADRLSAFYQSPVTGGFRHEGPFLAPLRALPPAGRFPNIVRRPPGHQALRPRGRADLARLGLPPTPELLAAMGL